jgi:hypothetical protein
MVGPPLPSVSLIEVPNRESRPVGLSITELPLIVTSTATLVTPQRLIRGAAARLVLSDGAARLAVLRGLPLDQRHQAGITGQVVGRAAATASGQGQGGGECDGDDRCLHGCYPVTTATDQLHSLSICSAWRPASPYT